MRVSVGLRMPGWSCHEGYKCMLWKQETPEGARQRLVGRCLLTSICSFFVSILFPDLVMITPSTAFQIPTAGDHIHPEAPHK